jgi:hypothetical protein
MVVLTFYRQQGTKWELAARVAVSNDKPPRTQGDPALVNWELPLPSARYGRTIGYAEDPEEWARNVPVACQTPGWRIAIESDQPSTQATLDSPDSAIAPEPLPAGSVSVPLVSQHWLWGSQHHKEHPLMLALIVGPLVMAAFSVILFGLWPRLSWIALILFMIPLGALVAKVTVRRHLNPAFAVLWAPLSVVSSVVLAVLLGPVLAVTIFNVARNPAAPLGHRPLPTGNTPTLSEKAPATLRSPDQSGQGPLLHGRDPQAKIIFALRGQNLTVQLDSATPAASRLALQGYSVSFSCDDQAANVVWPARASTQTVVLPVPVSARPHVTCAVQSTSRIALAPMT